MTTQDLPGAQAPLIADVTNVSIKDIMESDNPTLKASMQRIVDSLNDPDGVLCAFGSFVA